MAAQLAGVGMRRRMARAYMYLCVNRFYPKTQLSWLARLDHSHCNSADPLTDGLEVCCVFYRPGPGGCYVCCVVVEGFGEQGEGGDAPQGSRRPRGGCHRGLGHMHCDSAGPWQASASRRLRKGCPGAMSSTRTTQIWRGASIGRAVRVGKNIHFPVRRLLVACRKRRKSSPEMLPKCHYRSSRRIDPLASAWGVDLATISTEAT